MYGFAATLGVGSNTLSAGNVAVASCQATGTLTGTYTTAYDSTIPGYKVASVIVTGLDDDLRQQGRSRQPSRTLEQLRSCGTLDQHRSRGGGTLTLTPSSSVSAATVAGVSVAING